MYGTSEHLLVPNPRKSAGKKAVCVPISKDFPRQQSRRDYPAGFYVKGWLNSTHFKMVKLIKLQDGSFLFPVPNQLRIKYKLKAGDTVRFSAEKDRLYYQTDMQLSMALMQEPKEVQFWYFFKLSKVQKHLFDEWIGTAKTEQIKQDRIVKVLHAIRNQLKFREMKKG